MKRNCSTKFKKRKVSRKNFPRNINLLENALLWYSGKNNEQRMKPGFISRPLRLTSSETHVGVVINKTRMRMPIVQDCYKD